MDNRINTNLMKIREMYQSYVDTAVKLEREKRPLAGMIQGKGRPADAPCHGAFVEEMDGKTRAVAAGEPSPQEVREILNFILCAPHMFRQPEMVYWTMIAAQGSALCLIPYLDKGDALALQQKYGRDFRRWQRLPVQKMVYKALGRQAK